ncbi:hypothetical protein Tco_0791269 [Tanacetum coccineum]
MPVQTRTQLATDPEMCMSRTRIICTSLLALEAFRIFVPTHHTSTCSANLSDGRENGISINGPLRRRFMFRHQKGSYDPDHPKKSTSDGKLCWIKQAPRATEYQLADMFTKALPEDWFKYLVRRIGMRCLTPADLEVLTNETA